MKTILLVEDSMILAMVGIRMLKKNHFKVLHMNSGERAVEMIQNDKSPYANRICFL